ncbi:MAG: IclR family transcriptional regulator [Desulfuromonadales bacterium]|nr:IclR family transcriptional regulator [Desulfuromonadales bacterium]
MRSRSNKLKSGIPAHDDRARSDYEIRSVTKALDLLEAICEDEVNEPGGHDEEVRVTALSKRLGMSKSAVFRLLATFENRGYVERIAETGIYRIGVNAFEVGRRLLLRMGLLRHSRPVMEELSRQCNEAVYLAIRRGSEFLFIDVVESAQQVKVASLVGKRFPLTSAAPGQVINAYSDPAGVQLNDSSSMPGIRLKGYCYEQEGLGEMVGCLAAPFFDNSGGVAGAICVVGPSYRMPDLQIESLFWPMLKDASEAISSKLGYLMPYVGNVRL